MRSNGAVVTGNMMDVQYEMASHAREDTACARRVKEQEQIDKRKEYSPPFAIGECDAT
jgi:hypothetical protein